MCCTDALHSRKFNAMKNGSGDIAARWARYTNEALDRVGRPANAEVAKRLGVSPGTVGNWVNGTGGQPDASYVVSFARAYCNGDVYEALAIAGYIRPEEVPGERPPPTPDLSLLAEDIAAGVEAVVREHLTGDAPKGPSVVTPLRPKTVKSAKQARADQARNAPPL